MPAARSGDGSSDVSLTAAVDLTRDRPRQVRNLTQAAVTRVALAIVDDEGLGALTMRRVADELGVGLATLYNAATSKNAILLDMVDSVLAELPEADRRPGQERAALLDTWTATHELLCEHPSVVQLGTLQPVGGERLFGLVEATLELLRAGGVREDDLPTAYQTLRSYALGYTLLRISRTGGVDDRGDDWRQAMSRLPSEEFPEVTSHVPVLAGPMTTEGFVAGLDHLLRGFMPESA